MQAYDLMSMRDTVCVFEQVLYSKTAVRNQIRNEFKEGVADNWVVTPDGGKFEYIIEFDGTRFRSEVNKRDKVTSLITAKPMRM